MNDVASHARNRRIEPLSLAAAEGLINFRGPGIDGSLATQQLEGAVAVHNILARRRVAYLADEVGLGKTYIALGVVGLLRRSHPDLRVLYIAPRENIQKKWMKELESFTRTNWRHQDQRVRTVADQPTSRLAYCPNLVSLAEHLLRDPRCDPFLRMPSFSLALPEHDRDRWKEARRKLTDCAPVLKDSELDLRGASRHSFVSWYGGALNALLPKYDLIVVDEAHHLRHGLGPERDGHGVATRNHLLARMLGALPSADDPPSYGPRFDRVLLLSATPLESDFLELYRQLEIFGAPESFRDLARPDAEVPVEQKRDVASRFLVRRVTELTVHDQRLTKNLYRREWRGGGVQRHDDPLAIPDDRQRLIVGLIQKKVADVVNSPRFNASFQIGMLASFESFYETARHRVAEEQVFEGEDQGADDDERRGIDADAVGRIAESYRKTFDEPLPHPKMDGVVESLTPSLERGEKTLVFVRRVKSVPELGDKLRQVYDRQLRERLLRDLDAPLRAQLDEAWQEYEADRRERIRREEVAEAREEQRAPAQAETDDPEEDEIQAETAEAGEPSEDEGAGAEEPLPPNDTFFAWFFRGEKRSKWLSGGAFRKGRLQGQKSPYRTFFDDNHVLALLGMPDDPLVALAQHLDRPVQDVEADLLRRAWSYASDAWDVRYNRFKAYQRAALDLLSDNGGELAEQAAVVLELVHDLVPGTPVASPPSGGGGQARDMLGLRTFFTELRRRPALREMLWPEASADGAGFRARLRDRETRRELIAAAARLGHAYLDLWTLAVNGIGSLRIGGERPVEGGAEKLITEFLDRLEHQMGECERGARSGEPQELDAYAELSQIAEHHDTILRLNFPRALGASLGELGRIFGRALAKQTPVGGMSGGVNGVLVNQFRMPGYPLVLVTTDVVQEGEDLHLFCDRVIHYGITWTPSAMEQRTGRIDRVGCLVRRRLEALPRPPRPEELLQVHYPYLAETLERVQVYRVFRRMNAFMRLVHRGYGGNEGDPRVDTKRAMLEDDADIAPYAEPLRSAFPVKDEHCQGLPAEHLDAPEREVERLLARLGELWRGLMEAYRVRVMPEPGPHARVGVLYVDGDRVVPPADRRDVGEGGVRHQALFLQLRTAHTGEPLLHLSSPVGEAHLDDELALRILEFQQQMPEAKICQRPSGSRGQCLLTVEADMLMTQEPHELIELAARVVRRADQLEHWLFEGRDESPEAFMTHLRKEGRHG